MSDLLTIPLQWYILYSNWEIYSVKNKKFLKQRVNNAGYKQCKISLDWKIKMIDVHRLIAKAFIPNIDNKQTVNHKNGNKLDNRVDNLEWMTYKENTNHAINTLWIKIWFWDVSGSKNWKARRTWQYSKEWNLIKVWDYAKQATSSVDICMSMITACCRGERKTWWWYIRKYL